MNDRSDITKPGGSAPAEILRDPYLEWVDKEAIPVVEDFGVNLVEVETGPWPRFDTHGAAVHLKGRGDFMSMFVIEMNPGTATAPRRHLYEETIYVLSGHGSTTIESGNGQTYSFEWGVGSLFAIPLNATFRHFNVSGIESARIVCSTTAPAAFNIYHSEAFIFENPWNFPERLGHEKYFNGDGDYIGIKPGQNIWETNFVPNLMALELPDWTARGAGSTNINLIMADSVMHVHTSEMPVGTYKKAHRHDPGAHVMCVTGKGYSLGWYKGESDLIRVDWTHGVVFAPPNNMFHQHFNAGATPARYLATIFGSIRYPFLANKRALNEGAVDLDVKLGGSQIEYEDQFPLIAEMFEQAARENGFEVKMSKYNIPGMRK
jgi:mannose-6-phosphate isomerase-like protein (cupin superfamily)